MKGHFLYNHKEYKKSADCFADVLEIGSGDDYEACMSQAKCYINLRMYNEAASSLEMLNRTETKPDTHENNRLLLQSLIDKIKK